MLNEQSSQTPQGCRGRRLRGKVNYTYYQKNKQTKNNNLEHFWEAICSKVKNKLKEVIVQKASIEVNKVPTGF